MRTDTLHMFNVCVNQRLFPAPLEGTAIVLVYGGHEGGGGGGQGPASLTGPLTLQTLTPSHF